MPDTIPTREAVGQTRPGGEITVFRDPDNGYSRTAPDLPPGMDARPEGMPPTNGVTNVTVPEVPGGMAQTQAANQSTPQTSYSDKWCLEKSRDIYVNGRDYMEANITLNWERNLYHFHNEHGPRTPYSNRAWRRARTFRPKTRANVKSQEAAHAAAAFSTQDYLDCQPFDSTDPKQIISSHINKTLVQWRLETAPWKWLMTAQGAFQDTKIYGLCITHQYWWYRKISQVVPAFDDGGAAIMGTDAQGQEVQMGRQQSDVLADCPRVDNCAPELVLFDPTCDWRNPAQSSSYLKIIVPMRAGEVLELMETPNIKTQEPAWRKYPLESIISTKERDRDNRTRRAREGYHRIDPTMESASKEFTVVYAHLNIVREKGVDLVFWTLGTQFVLTTPVPLAKMCPWLPPGERPIVIGFSTIETNRNFPDGDVAQVAPLQEEINAVANQRLDNVRLALNKRYFIRRGSQMDLDALMRNVPGGGVMTNDPEKDVQVINTPDVTASSYREQELLSQDLDELVGGFGPGAAQNAGKMVDRAGSLDQMQGAAGAVQDYGIKLFFDTWMEPVLRQLVLLEQYYETDTVLIANAAKQSPVWQHFGQDVITDELLQQKLTVRINVGMGNTDPVKRVQKLVFGVGQVMQLPDMARRAKGQEIADEIMGALGYKDATRFFMNDQELQIHMKTSPPQIPPDVQVKMQELQQRKAEADQRHQRETQANTWTHQDKQKELELHHQKDEHNVGIQAGRNKTQRDIGAAKEYNRLAEVNLKRADGARPKPQAPGPAKPPSGGGKK